MSGPPEKLWFSSISAGWLFFLGARERESEQDIICVSFQWYHAQKRLGDESRMPNPAML